MSQIRILYLDCFSGISGDMLIGALLDVGADADALAKELAKLGLASEYQLTRMKVNKKGIVSTKFDVILDHDHSEQELQLAHHHQHEVIDLHHHHHQDSHTHTHHHETHIGIGDKHHHHEHRSYKSIIKLIKEAGFEPQIEEVALSIFKKIGEAEAKIHGINLEDVHFHEVGAVDSIVDIVGIAVLLKQLNIDKVYASSVPVGSGRIHIDHGMYPVPAPATLELLIGIPILQSSVKGELTTPTGAGVLAALASQFGPIPSMTVLSIGYGAGTKDFPNHPNVLRAIIGEI